MADPMIANLRLFAGYNAWANRRVGAACGALDPAEYKKRRAAFFGTIHATLNHILVNDRIWLARFAGRESGIARLDEELCPDLASLERAQTEEDARLVDLARGLDAERARRLVRYTTIDDFTDHADPLWLLLVNLFNHQTHHRGQVHDMLSQTTLVPPPLDLIHYVRESRPLSG